MATFFFQCATNKWKELSLFFPTCFFWEGYSVLSLTTWKLLANEACITILDQFIVNVLFNTTYLIISQQLAIYWTYHVIPPLRLEAKLIWAMFLELTRACQSVTYCITGHDMDA